MTNGKSAFYKQYVINHLLTLCDVFPVNFTFPELILTLSCDVTEMLEGRPGVVVFLNLPFVNFKGSRQQKSTMG